MLRLEGPPAFWAEREPKRDPDQGLKVYEINCRTNINIEHPC